MNIEYYRTLAIMAYYARFIDWSSIQFSDVFCLWIVRYPYALRNLELIFIMSIDA